MDPEACDVGVIGGILLLLLVVVRVLVVLLAVVVVGVVAKKGERRRGGSSATSLRSACFFKIDEQSPLRRKATRSLCVCGRNVPACHME
jgi:hypothetical protein